MCIIYMLCCCGPVNKNLYYLSVQLELSFLKDDLELFSTFTITSTFHNIRFHNFQIQFPSAANSAVGTFRTKFSSTFFAMGTFGIIEAIATGTFNIRAANCQADRCTQCPQTLSSSSNTTSTKSKFGPFISFVYSISFILVSLCSVLLLPVYRTSTVQDGMSHTASNRIRYNPP